MKLLVSSMNGLSAYVTRELYFIMQDLIQVHGWCQIDPSELSQDTASAKALLLARFGELPEVIVFWETYSLCIAMLPVLLEMRCRTFFFVDDLHCLRGEEGMRSSKLVALSLSSTILATCAYAFHGFYPELQGKKKLVWTPHSASPDFQLPFNEEPDDVILLSGALAEQYPLRRRLKAFHDEGRYAIMLHQHPGYGTTYNYGTDERVGPSYARRIHRCRTAFTDASTFRYVVAKYFEIPATGALLLADDAVGPELKELGFVEGIHYIGASAGSLEDRVRFVLDRGNRREIDEIRRRGQELVLARHTSSHRAALIDEVCSLTSSIPHIHHS